MTISQHASLVSLQDAFTQIMVYHAPNNELFIIFYLLFSDVKDFLSDRTPDALETLFTMTELSKPYSTILH